MKNQLTICLFLLLSLTYSSLVAQDSLLQHQLEESGYLKNVMKPDLSNAGLTRWRAKEVQDSRILPLAEDFESLKIKGPGVLKLEKVISKSGRGSIEIITPSSLAIKNPSNRSYASAEMIRPLDNEDLRGYNRFSVWVYADAPGFYSVFVGCTIYNEGEKVMPTPGRFEGQHFETVYPNKWHQIVWELPDLYRDKVTGLSVNVMLTGSPKGASDTLKLYVDDMRIENVQLENTRGFDLRKNALAYSHSGYRFGSKKQALVQNVENLAFELLNEDNTVAFNGMGVEIDNEFVQLDFSEFNKSGYYRLKIDNIESKPFPIGDEAYLATAWRTLNFFFAERCGFDQPSIHQVCHQDVTCIHPNGQTLAVNGGWHDAADLTQGVGNTARGGMSMLELAKSVKGKNNKLYDRLLAEARWGLNWTMQTRFGDGYREGGLIIGIWTDNINGTKDDIQGKASNNPFDNFIAASFCAEAVPFYQTLDPVFAEWCRKSAIEDFWFASERLGMFVTDKNETELYAQATVSAMHLYRLTNEQQYADLAAIYAQTVMDGQQKARRSDLANPLHGFFYESSKKKRILEYFHRSNEELMVQGLSMLLTDLPKHRDATEWEASCLAYADYLKEIESYIIPYGILPSAIYEIGNADFSGIYHEGDNVGMPSMKEYNAQVINGIPLSNSHYLRRFPVSYQFRGFHGILIGKAKAAFMLAKLFNDSTLRNIASRQLEYIVGYNPFAMSTIYGDGYDYPPLYGAYAGDVVGAVPVGIETFENEDEPYMPMQVNATYKEIWTNTTAGVMWLVSKQFEY